MGKYGDWLVGHGLEYRNRVNRNLWMLREKQIGQSTSRILALDNYFPQLFYSLVHHTKYQSI